MISLQSKHRDRMRIYRIFLIVLFLVIGLYFVISSINSNAEDMFEERTAHRFASILGLGESEKGDGMKEENSNLRSRSFFDSSTENDYRPNIMSNTVVEHPAIIDFEFDANQYPSFTPLLDIIKEWNPDEADPPEHFAETLIHLDYQNDKEMELAFQLRNAEVPFKVYNVPQFHEVSEKWTTTYLSRKFRSQGGSVERSKNNHFMFWANKKQHIRDFKPPTEVIPMSFDKWLERAKYADEHKLGNASEHRYYQMGTNRNTRGKGFVSKDIKDFSSKKKNFFVFRPDLNKGIQCRFGMRGVIAESHYDGGRNMVAMIRGTKRYILAPPRACPHLGIISDTKHPSFRHSVIDWSDVKQAEASHFDQVDAIDTILKEGEVLYIPSYWFHYIISLEYSIQCNSRSGGPENDVGKSEIDSCLGLDTKRSKGRKRRSK